MAVRLLGREDERSQTGQEEQPRQRKAFRPVNDDESLLKELTRKAGNSAISGLSAVGNFLDTPGSVVRDLSTWVPGGIKAQNPLDQLLTPFSSENRTTGEQLLQSAGLVGKGKSQSTMGSVGRFASGVGLEIAMDPLTYLTLGASALGKSGSIARRAGLLDDAPRAAAAKAGKVSPAAQPGKRVARQSTTLRDLMDFSTSTDPAIRQASAGVRLEKLTKANKGKPLTDDILDEPLSGGAFRVGVPFTDKSTFLLKGDRAMKYAEAADKAAEAVRFGKYSPVRAIAPVFSKAVKNTRSAEAQKEAIRVSRYEQDALANTRYELMPHLEAIEKSGVFQGDNALDTSGLAMEYLEDVGRGRPGAGTKFEKLLDGDGNIVMKRYMRELPPEVIQQAEDLFAKVDAGGLPAMKTSALKDLASKYGVVDDTSKSAKDLVDEMRTKRQEFTNDVKVADEAQMVDGGNRPQFSIDEDAWMNDPRFEALQKSGIMPSLRALKEKMPEVLALEKELGVKVDDLDDLLTYFPRVKQTSAGPMRRAAERSPMASSDQFATGRQSYLRGITGGTSLLNRMSLDKDFAGVLDKGVRGSAPIAKEETEALFQKFREKYGNTLADGEVSFADPAAFEKQTRDLFKMVTSRPMEDVKAGVPMFTMNPAEAALKRLEAADKAMANAVGRTNLIRDFAKRYPESMGVKRAKVAKQAVETFGEEATPAMVAMDGHARLWAKATGNKADEWHDRIGEIKNTSKAGDAAVGAEVQFAADGRATIQAMQSDSVGSFAAAAGQVFRRSVAEIEPDLLRQAEQALGVQGGNWTREAENAFAKQFETYIQTKQSPAGLKGIFEKFKEWTTTTYRSLIGKPSAADTKAAATPVNPELAKVFDGMLGDSDELVDVTDSANLNSVLANIGFNHKAAQARVIDQLGGAAKQVRDDLFAERVRDAQEAALKAGAEAGDDVSDAAAYLADINDDLMRGIKEPTPSDVLAQFNLPQRIADDLTRVDNAINDPGVVIAAYDAFTNWFKTNVTAVAPAFHVRNFFSGFVQNALHDVYDPRFKPFNPRRFTQPYSDSLDLVMGREIDGANTIPGMDGMTNAEASNEIRRLVAAAGLLDSPGMQNDLVASFLGGRTAQSIPGLQPIRQSKNYGRDLPGFRRLRDAIDIVRTKGAAREGTTWKDSINPTKTAGFLSEYEDYVLSRYGRAAGDVVETGHRAGGFIALLRQGYDHGEAARRIKELQVDYSNLTKSERNVMRRAIPFYGFQKGMATMIGGELYRRPGGPMAQSIRMANRASSSDASTPDYIRQGLSVPLGDGEDGSKNFLTGLGLMHEAPLSQLQPSVQGSTFNLLAQFNPLPKWFLERATNESLFQSSPQGGRSLDDQDPLVGRLGSNIANTLGLSDRTEPYRLGKNFESIVANSPAARYLSTARQAFDPRKTVMQKLGALGTGMRVTTVSPGSQDAVLRENATALMREMGGKAFERIYIPDSVLATMSPAERDQAEQWMALMRFLAKRAKGRKAEREAEESEE